MSKINSVKAREVLDSRGNPTVEVDLKTDEGLFRAMVPSGASTGVHEALELRDGDDKRYNSKGVLKAVGNVNSVIAPKVVGMECTKQAEIDRLMSELDGTENKEKLGANAILGVSMAACKAGAAVNEMPLYSYITGLAGSRGVTLPVPQFNVLNGGKHAGMENDPQEHMYMPVGAKTFREGLRMGAETYHLLKKMLKDEYGVHAIQLGDEGGFVPPIKTVHERLEMMESAAEKSGYGKDLARALDPASSEFYYKDGGYYMIGDEKYSPGELVDFYADLCGTFNIVSIEDGMAEDDWDGWVELNRKLGGKIQLTGDDLLVTNVKRIKKAIELNAVNALLLKVNQIGTITESVDAALMTFGSGWCVTVSHRSGETEDSFIADLAVGLDTGQIKTGAPARSERLAKYNQLLRIEDELGGKAKYPGRGFRKTRN
jgi:enolase